MKNFKKIVLTIMLGILVLLPSAVYAKTEVKSEEELKAATKNGGDIVLQNDITLKSGLEIEGSNVIVDLNGKTITIDESSYIFLKKGNLEFTGTGIIKDVTDNNQSGSTIYVRGSEDKTAKDFSTLTVGKDVTIETTQWGINLTHSQRKAYGVTLNFNGTLITSSVDCGGITVHGNVKNDGKLDNAKGENTDSNILSKTVDNKKGFTMPTTGGMGTYIFTIGGLVVMAGAVLLLVSSKKKRA